MFTDRIRWHRFADSTEAIQKRIPMHGLAFFKVAGKNIVVAHNENGVFAVRNRCPHQHKSFHGGVCTPDNKIICPIHRYAFDLETGRGGGGLAVEAYPLEERENGLFIGFPYVAFTPFGSKK